MIEFSHSGKPGRLNKKCEKCCGDCKQHAEVKVIFCPNQNRVGAAKLEKC